MNPSQKELVDYVEQLAVCYSYMRKTLEHGMRFLDSTNIRELSADKITAGTIKALIKIIDTEIIGGIIKTAEKGKRVEISENQIKCYNADGKLNGFCIDESDEHYGDASFYSEGVKLFTIYNNLQGISLMPVDSKPLSIGSSGSTTTFAGDSVFPSIKLDSGTSNLELYFDGTDLKVKCPDGSTGTVTIT